MKRNGFSTLFLFAGKTISFFGATAGVVVTLLCCMVLACTAVVGYPDFFGTGFMLADGRADGLPDNDLVFFESCSAEEIAADDFVVYASAAGIKTGRVYSLTASHMTVRSVDGSVTAFPVSAVLGKATSHNPHLGKAVSGFAGQSNAGLVGGIAVALTAMFLLVSDIRKREEKFLS